MGISYTGFFLHDTCKNTVYTPVHILVHIHVHIPVHIVNLYFFNFRDSVPHVKDSELNEMKIYYNVGNVTDQLLKAFPSTPIYPVLGNHDEYPKDAFPAVNTTYYSNILSVSNWSELLHQSEAEQFKVGKCNGSLLIDSLSSQKSEILVFINHF